jgi:hypothetical protein
MLRRDFVRAVVSVGLVPQALLAQQAGKPQLPLPAPVPWPSGLTPETPVPHTQVAETIAEAQPEFFTSAQMATLTRLSDVLMPPVGNKPGALQAGTPLFLDFFIGKSNNAIRKRYTSGLDWLNAEAVARFKSPFAKLDNAKADAILKPWLRAWMSDHPPLEPHAEFINVAHSDIRSATVNSKVWDDVPSVGAQEKTEADLYWMPIEPDMNSVSSYASHPLAHGSATPKPNHPMPEYSR